MSQTIDYAEMLEIPVSTLNVTKKRSTKKKEEADLKERVVESVNERVEEAEDPIANGENVTDYGENAYSYEEEKPHRAHKKFLEGKLLMVEFVAVIALCAAILLTNIFWPSSAINTFFRGLIEGKPTAAAPDDRTYSELTLGSVISDDDIVCSVGETGVLTFTGTCSVYAPYGGTVQSIVENEGTYTMEIQHTTSFSTVIAGLSNVYLAAGDTVYATIPVGYSAGGEISVSMFDSGSLIHTYTVNENNDIVWNA